MGGVLCSAVLSFLSWAATFLAVTGGVPERHQPRNTTLECSRRLARDCGPLRGVLGWKRFSDLTQMRRLSEILAAI